MLSSNDFLRDLAESSKSRNSPRFEVVVAFSFYDGPEDGLAVFNSGAGVRFTAIGESPDLWRRAFEFSPIDGDWLPRVRKLGAVGASRDKVFVPSEESELLSRLELDVRSARALGDYVAIAHPYFKWVRVACVTAEEALALRYHGPSTPDHFIEVEKIVEERKQDLAARGYS